MSVWKWFVLPCPPSVPSCPTLGCPIPSVPQVRHLWSGLVLSVFLIELLAVLSGLVTSPLLCDSSSTLRRMLTPWSQHTQLFCCAPRRCSWGRLCVSSTLTPSAFSCPYSRWCAPCLLASEKAAKLKLRDCECYERGFDNFLVAFNSS